MQDDIQNIYNLSTLSKKTGFSPRTIRYYIQRELLPKPEGGGRKYYYTEEHLRRLKLIKKWSKQGVPLEKIKEYLSEDREHALFSKSVKFCKRDNSVITAYCRYVLPQEFHKKVPDAPYQNSLINNKNPKSKSPSETSLKHWLRVQIGTDIELNFSPGSLSEDDLKAITEFICSRLKIK